MGVDGVAEGAGGRPRPYLDPRGGIRPEARAFFWPLGPALASASVAGAWPCDVTSAARQAPHTSVHPLFPTPPNRAHRTICHGCRTRRVPICQRRTHTKAPRTFRRWSASVSRRAVAPTPGQPSTTSRCWKAGNTSAVSRTCPSTCRTFRVWRRAVNQVPGRMHDSVVLLFALHENRPGR